ncbi:MAG: imidazole glycerol phosphate synthase subunit HisH [Chitinispirillaceae bacterium]
MIAIVDYEAGNLTSVKRALDYLGIANKITPDPDEVLSAERIIFPGVGHASSAMAVLKERRLDKALVEAFGRKTPIMGICLGTQIILSHSEEGDTECLGLVQGECRRFSLKDRSLKIPHMGWNSIRIEKPHPVFKEVKPEDEFYFVHSYYPLPKDEGAIVGKCEYETDFPAVIGNENLVATQFHPEKSGPVGLSILKNFSLWDGSPC